jgi:hypothetical protein
MAKLTGIIYDVDLSEYDSKIDEAVVTRNRIAIDWEEDGETLHLLAQSKDGGCSYVGNYGSPQPNKNWVMELTRYTATDGSVILIGYWRQKDTGNEGSCLFELGENWE